MRVGRLAIIGMSLLGGRAEGGDPSPQTQREKLSYGLGVSMARSVQRQGVEVDADLVARGLKDGLSGQKLLLGEDDLRAAVGQAQAEVTRKKARPARTPAEAKREGEAFLAENARKEGVVSLPSGLQYKVLRAGAGRTPTDADRVVCHYRGTLVDGTEFDSTYGRGRPATLDMARVIPGWRQALRLMPVGSKWQLFIPPQLAYGERGARGRKRSPGKIGPNTTLVFETELLAIQPGSGSPDRRTAAAAEQPAAKGN